MYPLHYYSYQLLGDDSVLFSPIKQLWEEEEEKTEI